MCPARRLSLPVFLGMAIALIAACGGTSSIKPSQTLDETTGMTVGTLDKPLELVQGSTGPTLERRASFAYLGPVEWDNMGTITYGLWIHVAPGSDWRFADIQTPGAVQLALDDASAALTAFVPPAQAHAPYRPVASWGQTGYFRVDLDLLRRMAGSARIALDVRTSDGKVAHFDAAPESGATLARFLRARGYQ